MKKAKSQLPIFWKTNFFASSNCSKVFQNFCIHFLEDSQVEKAFHIAKASQIPQFSLKNFLNPTISPVEKLIANLATIFNNFSS